MQPVTSDQRGPGRRRWHRFGFVLAIAALTSGLVLLPKAAMANLPNGCPDASTAGHKQVRLDNSGFRFPDGHDHAHVLLVFWIEQVTPTVRPLQSPPSIHDNFTFDTTQTFTFTSSFMSSTSVTNTISQQVQFTSQLGTVFSETVSNSIQQTVSITQTYTASGPVPPRTRITGVFGLDAFDIVFTVDYYQVDSSGPLSSTKCWYHGSDRHGFAQAPSNNPGGIGWRLSSNPI
jgi:hypothetical protein